MMGTMPQVGGEIPIAGILTVMASLSLLIWLVLVLFWGRFWWGSERLRSSPSPVDVEQSKPTARPVRPQADIIAIVPARNEADVLPETLRSLLTQNYTGRLRVLLVDDGSTDGTGELAHQLAMSLPNVKRVAIEPQAQREQTDRVEPADRPTSPSDPTHPIEFAIISPPPLPQGWTGKLWALDRGIAAARSHWGDPDYIWLTDADIDHPPNNIQRLVTHARDDRRELVSFMVQLRCQSVWERLMVPAFIFFFQKLYPFPWVNDPKKAMAAAAGGCILLQTSALDRIGGLSCVRQALIDDCALAWAVKHGDLVGDREHFNEATAKPRSGQTYRRIWLGLSHTTRSLRPYDSLASLWDMVARTAYTQLNYSPLLLVGTVLGMILVYLVPPLSAIAGIALGLFPLAIIGGFTWAIMVIAYRPTLRSYNQPTLIGVLLPAIATIYLLATIDSAWRHWRGYGGAWKGRTYAKH